ncbi:MAG: acyl-CoA dehydrogenase family protein [Tissierellia bacterium]|nr:acyl-CoA dehydrogenase family protein [Tissierellia bacterium]
MLFATTKEHEEFRMKVRAFAEEKMKPITLKCDLESHFPEELAYEMGKLDLMGIYFPKEYGGAGLDAIYYAIAVEELSRVDGGLGVTLSAHTSLGANPINDWGTHEQKVKWLTPLAKGEKIGAFGLTEENAGSDAGGTQTTAVKQEDGTYLLNGNKIFITNAGAAETYVVFAVTTPGIGTRGISAFILDKGMEGFTFGQRYNKLGIRSSRTQELLFKDVVVTPDRLLGKEGEGFKIAMQTLDGGRIGIASQALGIAQGAYEEAREYIKERVQFGKPLAAQQHLAFMIADMDTQIAAARLLIYKAAAMKSAHVPYSKEAAQCKLHASETAMFVTNNALQLHGGSGYLKGMVVERMYRDAKITTIYEGTSEIMRLVISSSILGKAGRVNKAKKGEEKPQGPTGARKEVMFTGSAEEQVDQLVEALKKDGYTFGEKGDPNGPLAGAKRAVAFGMGVKEKENVKLVEELAVAAGAVMGSSRPVAEELQWLPLDRYIGISGQKFAGELYIAAGISGAIQHLRGIKDAGTIVAINNDKNAKIFRNADYGLVGDVLEIVPLLTKKLQA